MWQTLLIVPNLLMAETWKNFFEQEGIPVRIMPASEELMAAGKLLVGEFEPRTIYVPTDKVHVAQEILRKLS